MKYILLVICTVLLLASCTGNKKTDDSKIKESITTYLTAWFGKKDMPKIDSVGLVSIDTLTEKNVLKISLDRKYNMLKSLNAIYESKQNLIKADSALLGMMRIQKGMFGKHGDKYDDTSLKEQEAKMITDSVELGQSLVEVQKTIKTIDSVSALYQRADSVAPAAYFVGATIYVHDSTPEPGNYIISKDWKVSR